MNSGDAEQPRSKKTDIRKATGSETADLVSEVLQDAKRREEARTRKAPLGRNRQRVAAVSLPLAGVFSFYLWFGQPAWVTPTMPDPVTAEKAEAGLRVAMFFEVQKIEEFRQKSGRIPDDLTELGGTPPREMTYQRVDARTYQIVGQSRGVTLTFNSDQAIQQFVGDAMSRLGLKMPR